MNDTHLGRRIRRQPGPGRGFGQLRRQGRGHLVGGAGGGLLVLLHERHNDEGPMPGPNLADDERIGAASRLVGGPGQVLGTADARLDDEPAGRH